MFSLRERRAWRGAYDACEGGRDALQWEREDGWLGFASDGLEREGLGRAHLAL